VIKKHSIWNTDLVAGTHDVQLVPHVRSRGQASTCVHGATRAEEGVSSSSGEVA
jgi:hypothetical protein